MAGLLDNLFATPSDQALWALGSGLLGVRRGQEGRAFSGAMDAYNQAQQEQRRNELVRIQQQMAQMQMQQMQQAMRDQEQQRAFFGNRGNFFKPPVPYGAGMTGSLDQQDVNPGSPEAPLSQRQIAMNMMQVPSLAPQAIGMLGKAAPIKLGAEETLLDPDTFRPIARGAPKTQQPVASLQEYAAAVSQGYKGTFEQWKKELARAGSSNIEVNTGQRGFQNSMDVLKEWKSEPIYKAHMEVVSAYNQIKQGIASQSPAGDLTAATKFMKLIDPNSVVRESELMMAMQATGLLDRMLNYANYIIRGDKLSPAQRRDFNQMAERLFSESEKLYREKQRLYIDTATRYGLDDQMILRSGPNRRRFNSVDEAIDALADPTIGEQ